MAVVGTLLSLLVFLSLFGTFLVFYLPLWMSDNESNFTSGVTASLAQLQSNMQLQAGTGSPPILSTPFTMSSDAVPLLSVPTTGTLAFLPRTPGASVTLSIPGFLSAGKPYVQNFGGSLGTMLLTLPNRYYTPENFQLEDGAVIQTEGDTNQLIAYPPIFSLVKTGTALSLNLMLVQMYGNATRLTSPGTIEVYSQLLGSTQTLKNNNTATVASLFLNVTTHYPCAWTNFFTQSRQVANVTSGQMSVASLDTSGCVGTSGQAKTISVVISNIAQVTLVLANFQVSAGIGVV
ncbi:MAG: hypothetical protein L3K14_02275 [Thermoplasmata archaeon]|nr:hypothetical protein [Thermoplasmata archaeon]